MNPKSIHYIKERECSRDIIIQIHIWIGGTLSKSLESCKVNHSIKLIFLEDFFQSYLISNISLKEVRTIPKNLFYPKKRILRTINQIIKNHCFVSSLFKSHNRMRPNISSSSSNEKCFLIYHNTREYIKIPNFAKPIS